MYYCCRMLYAHPFCSSGRDCCNVQAHAESSIGAWQLCLEMVGVVACLTNLLLAVLVSKNVDLYVPTSMAEQLGSFEAKVRLFYLRSCIGRRHHVPENNWSFFFFLFFLLCAPGHRAVLEPMKSVNRPLLLGCCGADLFAAHDTYVALKNTTGMSL